MKTLVALLVMVSAAYGQEKQAPKQGPPPKNLTEKADGHFSANGDPANPDKFEVYVVKKGDTLSQIAGQVLKNPALWPQLWEQNEQIVNPHWIYPDDKILIRPVTTVSQATPPEAPAAPAAAEPAAPPEPPKFTLRPTLTPIEPRPAAVFNVPARKSAPEIKASDLYCSGFIRMAAVPTDLKVVSKYDADESATASGNDYVYIDQGSEDGVEPGALYQVVRPTREIYNAQHKRLGTHYLDVARLEVVAAQPDFSMARIVSNCEAVEIGDILLPFTPIDPPQIAPVRTFDPLMKATGDIKGSIISTLGVLTNYGSAFNSGAAPGARYGNMQYLDNGVADYGAIVYIDVGANDGVKPGDSFIVYGAADQDQELYGLPAGAKKLKGFRVAVGELIVIKVEERSATALVTYATNGLSAGDSVERR